MEDNITSKRGSQVSALREIPRLATTRVAICIATFRRRDQLRALLAGIAQLAFHKVPTPRPQVVVVDNDELASGKSICDNVSVPWPVKYSVEPRRGITYARNRAILDAGDVDFVAFIDDDEVPSAHWLDELLWTQEEFGADVVSGPVSSTFAPEVPDWVRSGGFFDARVAATGTLRKTCACNNVLISTRVFKRVPGFDDTFALSGAEDTDFFLRVRQAGYKLVWSQEAIVSEVISLQRANVAWLLRREYQTGNGWVFCEARVDSSLRNWMLRSARAWGHILLGSLNAITYMIALDKVASVRSLQRASLGTGMLTALMGYRFMAYQSAGSKLVEAESPASSFERDPRSVA